MTDSPVNAEIEVEVRYAETDQMGVVHHANYLVWFELARTRLCHRSGYSYSEIEKLGYHLMVTMAQVHYRRGARYGDTVSVNAHIDRLGSRGMRFAYEVRRQEKVVATGTTEHVWVEAATGKLRRAPDVLREPFVRLARGTVSAGGQDTGFNLLNRQNDSKD